MKQEMYGWTALLTLRRRGGMLIGFFHRHQVVQILFQLCYWSTQASFSFRQVLSLVWFAVIDGSTLSHFWKDNWDSIHFLVRFLCSDTSCVPTPAEHIDHIEAAGDWQSVKILPTGSTLLSFLCYVILSDSRSMYWSWSLHMCNSHSEVSCGILWVNTHWFQLNNLFCKWSWNLDMKIFCFFGVNAMYLYRIITNTWLT